MSDLQELLDRATDRIESPDLATAALAGARRRRTARVGAGAAALTALVVLGVAVVGTGGGRTQDSPPTAPSPTSTPTQAPTEGATTPTGEWNPGDELPADDALEVDPPATVPALADQQMEAAVLAVARTTDPAVLLLGTDGSWRSVPREDTGYAGADLSTDGTRVAVETTDPVGVDVWDLATGEQRHLAPPAGYQPWEFASWTWVDDATLLLADRVGGWLVDVDSGEGTRVDYPVRALAWDVDDHGALLQSTDFSESSVLIDWAGGERRDQQMDQLGRFTTLAAGLDTIVGASYANGPLTLFALDRDDLGVRATLRILGGTAYGDGGLQVLDLLPDGRAVLQVSAYGRAPDQRGWELVTWDPGTGELALLAHGAPGLSVPFAVSSGVIG